MTKKPKKILILGSGGLKIGQALLKCPLRKLKQCF